MDENPSENACCIFKLPAKNEESGSNEEAAVVKVASRSKQRPASRRDDMATCPSLFAYYYSLTQWSPCCRLVDSQRSKVPPPRIRKTSGRRYSRRQQAEVERARMTVTQKRQVGVASDKSLGDDGRPSTPSKKVTFDPNRADVADMDSSNMTGVSTAPDVPEVAASPEITEVPVIATNPITESEQEAPRSREGNEKALLTKMKAALRFRSAVTKSKSSKSPVTVANYQLPQPQKASWVDLVQLMPLVDAYECDYFEDRLRSYRRAELMDQEIKGNTILHYAVSKQDASAIGLILARISDASDQVALIDRTNHDGVTAEDVAGSLPSSVRYGVLRAFGDARRLAVNSPP